MKGVFMSKIKLQSISASSRWLQCSASLKYNQSFTENVHTLKGNLIHNVSALRLREVFFNENHTVEIEKLKNEKYVSQNDPNLFAVWDSDCEKTSEGYVNYAIKLNKQYTPHTIEIEKKQWLKWYDYDKYGYVDLLMISDDYIIIVDLKTGRGAVDTEENTQMLLYAIGVIQEYTKKNNKAFILSIYQPLINNTQAFEYSLGQISQFYASKRDKMNEIITGELKYDPSPTACKWCDYRDSCNERIKKGVI